jgi:hypothetical protein
VSPGVKAVDYAERATMPVLTIPVPQCHQGSGGRRLVEASWRSWRRCRD